MKDIEKKIEEFLGRMEASRPEINRIIEENRSKIDTGRTRKPITESMKEIDFTEKDGNTEYEVVGHFDPDEKEAVISKIIHKLGYSFNG